MQRSSVTRFAAACLPACIALACLVHAPARADIAYFTSFSTGALVRFDTANPAGTATVLSGSGSTVSPAALALGPDGNLYIGEAGDGASYAPRITRFNLTTNTLSPVHTFAFYDVFPGSLAFKGNDLLVGRNPFYQNTGAVVRLAGATTGSVSVSDYTSGGSLASSPGLAIASDGRLYVSDQTYNFLTGIASGSVKRFDATGGYIGEMVASGSGGLYGPTGLAINGSTLFTASIMTGTIVQTNLGTDVTTAFASAGSAFEVGSLALLSNGGLLAGSPSGSGNIYRFGPDGSLASTYATGFGQIGGIVAVPEPTTAALALGGIALAAWRRWRRSRGG